MKEENELIRNLTPGRINAQFVIANKQLKTARTGNEYIELQLSDKTGQIVARFFIDNQNQVNTIFENLEESGFYQVRGEVQEFPRGSEKYNIKINNLTHLDEGDYELEDFIRITPHNREMLMDEIFKTIREIQNPHLKQVLELLFRREGFMEEFKDSPSAKKYHHNYIGGNLEHTVGVLRICKTLCQMNPELDQDLLYTGAILHDIGKLESYDYDMVGIEISKKGMMVDHIIIGHKKIADLMISMRQDLEYGSEEVDETIIEDVDELSIQLQHLIVSHHGPIVNGWGSSVDPKTPEAVALHYADNLDAKVKSFIQNGRI